MPIRTAADRATTCAKFFGQGQKAVTKTKATYAMNTGMRYAQKADGEPPGLPSVAVQKLSVVGTRQGCQAACFNASRMLTSRSLWSQSTRPMTARQAPALKMNAARN